MRATTTAYKQIIASGNTRLFHVKINMTLADNTQLELTDSDIMDGSFKIDTASSGTSSFDIGSAIIGMCKFSLRNYDERFTIYDFFNATAVVWVKLEGDSEFIRMGFFTVDEPKFAGGVVSIEMLDNMWKFDRPMPTISYPVSCQSAVNAICNQCGVTLSTQQFHGYNFQLTVSPEEEMNCREYLQYVAMIGCNFCRMSDSGTLEILWYDVNSRPMASLDGGTFDTTTTPYSDGDTADGGNFTDYDSGDNYDGGTFLESYNTAWFTRNFSATLGTDEITITGVKFTINDVAHRLGTDGYVLELENPLVDESNVNAVLNLIWDVLQNFRFRTFNIRTLPDVSAQIGDCCAVKDLKGNIVYTFITNISFELSAQTVQCNAVSPTRKLSTMYSKTVQAAVEESRKKTADAISRYDVAVQMMNNLAVNAMGAYQDYEDLATGGRIYYMSNKPITKTDGVCHFVANSTVFKASGDGFFVSTDGGQTFVNGYDAQTGQLVVNVLKAIGLSADWVETGLLTDKDHYNYWDLDNNIFHLSGGTTVGTGGTTLDDFAEKDGTITDVDVEYAKNQASTTAPTTGWSTTSPQWEEGYYIWQRTKTIDGEGTASYSDPVCIQGAKGQDGNSINSTTIEYGVSNSPSTMPSSWQSTVPVVSDGQYLWTKTTIDYTDPSVQDTVSYTYSKQGEDGQAGTSVTVSSIQYQQGDNATTPPTGTWSNVPIIVAQGKYLWTKTAYSDGSTAYTVAFQGVDGTDGTDGVGISSTTIEYGVSNDASTQPSSWSTTVPSSVAQGKWLWVRTTYAYSDSSSKTVYTKSYIGTDGEDGQTITVVSVVKVGKVTTVTFSDGSTMTIDDGADGTNGVNGLNGYVHTAWALTVQGMDGATQTTGFSTSDSVGKKYLGSYTDNSSPDSSDWHSYSWSLIKGADGEDGTDGVGISSIVEQYYLSTSSSTPTGGSWSNTQPTWVDGKYIWTRSYITWDDGTTSTTTPILAQGLNQANKKAYDTDANLDQDEIMYRIAGGDPTQPNQGIFLQNGKCYINGEYLKANSINANNIQGGTLKLGGTYGTVLSVYDDNNNYVGGIRNDVLDDNVWFINEAVLFNKNNSDGGYEDITFTSFHNKINSLSSNLTKRRIYRPYRFGQRVDQEFSWLLITIKCYDEQGNFIDYNGTKIGEAYIEHHNGSSSKIVAYAHTVPIPDNGEFYYIENQHYYAVYNPSEPSDDDELFKDVGKNDDDYYRFVTILYRPTLYAMGVRNIEYSVSYGDYKVVLSTDGIFADTTGYFHGVADIYDADYYTIIDSDDSSVNARGTVNVIYDENNRIEIGNADIIKYSNGSSVSVRWSTSDARMKENIQPLDKELSRRLIDSTETKRFKYKNIKGIHYGMIAQEARKILDDLGETDSMLEHSMNIPKERAIVEDQRTLDYEEYIPHLINYIKDLRAELNAVKEELRQLKEGK